VVNFKARAMIDSFDQRAAHGVDPGLLMLHPDSCQASRSHRASCSRQKGLHLETMMPSTLQMPLLNTGGLIAKPGIAEICVGIGSYDVGRHGMLLVSGREAGLAVLRLAASVPEG
jgi:hypothetical protein